MVNARQWAPGFRRIIDVRAARSVRGLLLQQVPSLPQEAGITGAVAGGDRLADPSAERIIPVVRFKYPLRARTPGCDQPVLRIIREVLLIQPAAPAGQVAPRINA